MRLNLFLASVILIASLSVSAQNLKIWDHDDASDITSGSISKANWEDGTTSIYVDVSNVGNQTISVGYKRYEINVVAGTKNKSCSPELCYGDMIAGSTVFWVAPDQINFQNDSVGKKYTLYHSAEGMSGTSTYRYVFYDNNNHNDSAYVDVIFETPLSTSNISQSIEFNVFPNPAMDHIDLTVDQIGSDGEFLVMDMLGTVVKRTTIAQTNTRMDVSNLRAGIYFYALHSGNKQVGASKKLVIK